MRIILFAAVLVFTSLPICAPAQIGTDASHKQKVEQLKIKKRKISYFETNLKLTPDQQEKFWALYDKIQSDKENILKERRKLNSSITRFVWIDTTISNSEKRNILDEYRLTFKKENDLDNKLYLEMLKILPIDKVSMFSILEKTFNDMLIREFVEKRMKIYQQKVQSQKKIEEVKSPIVLPFLESPNQEPKQSIILLPQINTAPGKSHKNK